MALHLPVGDDYVTFVFKLTPETPKFAFSFEGMNIATKVLQTALALSYQLFRDEDILKSCIPCTPEQDYTN